MAIRKFSRGWFLLIIPGRVVPENVAFSYFELCFVSTWVKNLFLFGSFWYGAMVSLKISWLDEMLDSLLLMFSGMFLSNNGGWLLWLCL